MRRWANIFKELNADTFGEEFDQGMLEKMRSAADSASFYVHLQLALTALTEEIPRITNRALRVQKAKEFSRAHAKNAWGKPLNVRLQLLMSGGLPGDREDVCAPVV